MPVNSGSGLVVIAPLVFLRRGGSANARRFAAGGRTAIQASHVPFFFFRGFVGSQTQSGRKERTGLAFVSCLWTERRNFGARRGSDEEIRVIDDATEASIT